MLIVDKLSNIEVIYGSWFFFSGNIPTYNEHKPVEVKIREFTWIFIKFIFLKPY